MWAILRPLVTDMVGLSRPHFSFTAVLERDAVWSLADCNRVDDSQTVACNLRYGSVDNVADKDVGPVGANCDTVRSLADVNGCHDRIRAGVDYGDGVVRVVFCTLIGDIDGAAVRC